jgi:hypothetical protein
MFSSSKFSLIRQGIWLKEVFRIVDEFDSRVLFQILCGFLTNERRDGKIGILETKNRQQQRSSIMQFESIKHQANSQITRLNIRQIRKHS